MWKGIKFFEIKTVKVFTNLYDETFFSMFKGTPDESEETQQ